MNSIRETNHLFTFPQGWNQVVKQIYTSEPHAACCGVSECNRTCNVVPPSLIKQAPLYFCSASAPICLFDSSPKRQIGVERWWLRRIWAAFFPQMMGSYDTLIHPYICCGCVSFRVLPVLPIFMVINLHGFSPVQCTATFTDESVGCIMKPEFAPHLTRGQHICCSWLSKHCHCGARQKENFPRFSFFSGCLGWWVRKHWEWLRITETTVDTWNIWVFLPCSSDGSVLGPPWIWVIGIRQNMSHQDWFQWNLSRLMIIPFLTLWQRLFPGHKHHWTQYSQINYFLIFFFRAY